MKWGLTALKTNTLEPFKEANLRDAVAFEKLEQWWKNLSLCVFYYTPIVAII